MAKTSPHARAAPSSLKSSTTPNNSTPTRRKSADVLTPLVPPLYPSAPKPSPLNRDSSADKVNYYKKLSQYLTTNYAVHIPRKANTYAFAVHRYTDRYHVVSDTNPDVVPKIGPDRLPEELLTKKRVKRVRKVGRAVSKKSLDDLHEDEDAAEKAEEAEVGALEDGADVGDGDDDGDGEEGEPGSKKSRAAAPPTADAMNDSMEEDDMEDADEELDQGTDYAANYFDNGEDFLDSDREGDDDGPVY